MTYLKQWSVICLQLPTSILVFYLVYLSKKVYRARGITLWLLIANGIPMFMYSFANIFAFSSTKSFIEADSSDLDAAYTRYLRVDKVIWWLDFTGYAIYNTVHWIFSLKYWTLSFKFQMIKQGRNPD